MRIKFTIANEKTITNTTAKISIVIEGTIAGNNREECEQRALKAAKSLLDASWAFTNFQYKSNNLNFIVAASTRVDAQLNDKLAERAAKLSDHEVAISISNIDTTVPPHDIRTGESELRVAMIEQARKEAVKLEGELLKVVFQSDSTSVFSNSKNASYMASASAVGGAPAALGHSEKITLSAEVTVEV